MGFTEQHFYSFILTQTLPVESTLVKTLKSQVGRGILRIIPYISKEEDAWGMCSRGAVGQSEGLGVY